MARLERLRTGKTEKSFVWKCHPRRCHTKINTRLPHQPSLATIPGINDGSGVSPPQLAQYGTRDLE